MSNVKEANINLIYAGRARANLLLASSAEERQSHVQNIDKYTAKVVDYMTRARASFQSEEGKNKLAHSIAPGRNIWTSAAASSKPPTAKRCARLIRNWPRCRARYVPARTKWIT